MKRKRLLVRNQSRGSGLSYIAALLLSAILVCVATEAFAYDFTAVNDEGVTIYYNYINDRQEAEVTCETVGAKNYSGAVTIPATVTVDETILNVTSIGEDAFYLCKSLTSVDIPNTVTNIAAWAFCGCANLTSFTIPDGVGCIENGAFLGCSGLTSVSIGNSVTKIGSMAFQSCTRLIDITIPNSVTSIENEAFAHCSSLSFITIPNSVESIGERAFSSCYNLASIEVEAGNPHYYKDGDCLIETTSNKLIRGCYRNSVSITIPNTVTNISDEAFFEFSSLTSVTIPISVTSIGMHAFQGCTSLTEVTLEGTTLPTTGIHAFNNISSEATLYCSAALLKKCQETEPWKNFKNIVVKPFSVTISDTGIATACSDKDLDFTNVEGVKAYIASGFNPTTGKVLLTRAMEIPAGTGFIVKGDEGTYEVPCSATEYMYANLLVGVQTETTLLETGGGYTNYVLGKNSTDDLGFYLPSEGFVLPANKAYLRLSTGTFSTTMSTLGISFGDEDGITTGFVSVKDLYNGSADKADVIYNVNGQRLSGLTKGLNIVNGKKILVK